MSILITTDVSCDRCGWWIDGCTGTKSKIRQARVIARGDGWKCDGNGDICAVCVTLETSLEASDA